MTAPTPRGSSYAAAGVDIEAGDRAVELLKKRVARASRPEVVGGLGGFAGLFRLDTEALPRPAAGVAAPTASAPSSPSRRRWTSTTRSGSTWSGWSSTTSSSAARSRCSCRTTSPCGRVVPERVAEIVGGIAAGCELAGCALVGGETAEHPGLMPDDHYDIAGTGVGVVEADELLGARPGPRPATSSSRWRRRGLHSNGFRLVRHVLLAGRPPPARRRASTSSAASWARRC